MGRRKEAADNRARMPQFAQLVDQMRSTFGDGVRVNHASEGGIEVGKPTPVERSMSGREWIHFLKTGELPC